MKQVIKAILTAAALVALAVPAMAAGNSKLIVKDVAGTSNVFTVTDAGQVGVGTDAPFADFQSTSTSTINGYRGVTALQISAGNPGSVMTFMRAAGIPSALVQPSDNNYIGTFGAQYYNGSVYDRSAQFGFRNDAPSSPGSFPTKIMFSTGDKSVNLKEGLAISSSQSVIAGNLGTTAAADMVVTATAGFLYIPNVAGALTSCATAASYIGHTPIWYDTTNNKICTCRTGVLKCTAAFL